MSTTLTIKDGAIRLPKEWLNAETFVRSSDDTIVIKRLNARPMFWETRQKLKAVGKKISKKDINDAILWARNRSK